MSDRNLVYLATPYSHPNPDVRESRYDLATEIAAYFSRLGHIIFSPITHSHPMAVNHDMPGSWDFWKVIDLGFLQHCHMMMIVALPAWKESTGVLAEKKFAEENGINVVFVSPKTFEIMWDYNEERDE